MAPEQPEPLAAENAQLRKALEQARQRLAQMEMVVARGEKRMEETDEVVHRLQEENESLRRAARAPELEEKRQAIEAEYQQLVKDSEDLQEEFRRHELTMARERADLGRSRAEVERARRDLEHLLDQAQKDAVLQAQMGKILDLKEAIRGRPGVRPAAPSVATCPTCGRSGAPLPGPAPVGGVPSAPGLTQPLPVDPRKLAPETVNDQQPSTKRSSLFRRILGHKPG